MRILANLYFDVAAIWQGLVFLLFCIPVVLVCEYEVYRVIYPKQGVTRAIITTIYANTVSGILGIFIGETLTDIAMDISYKLTGEDSGLPYEIILFVLLFVLTWLIEAIAVQLLRSKLKLEKVFIGVGIANLASYIILAIMLIVYKLAM